MDFALSDERRMIADSLRRYLADYDTEKRNQVAYHAPYHDPQQWQGLVELGILGAFLPEEQGGFGGKGFDISVIFEEVGRALCAEPLLAHLMSVRLLAEFDQADLLDQVLTGETQIALAIWEPERAEALAALETQATLTEHKTWQLHGHKSVVYGAPMAALFLVVAQSTEGMSLFLLPREKVQVLDYAMIDGGGAGEVIIHHTEAECLAVDVADALEAALDAGRLALAAEAVGAMDKLIALTVDYLGQRQQFGQPLARFQVLQHRCVDLLIELEQCRSGVILAASQFEGNDRGRFVSLAKNLVGRAGTLVSEEAIQMHGGIGMTWEYAGAHYAKRLIMIDHQLGDRHFHARRYATG